MKNDYISIITPSYNSAEYIEETIQSVLNQTKAHIDQFFPHQLNVVSRLAQEKLKDSKQKNLQQNNFNRMQNVTEFSDVSCKCF